MSFFNLNLCFKASEAEIKKFVALFEKIHEVPGKGCELEGYFYFLYILTILTGWLRQVVKWCST